MKFGIEIEFIKPTSLDLRGVARKVNRDLRISGYNDEGCEYMGYTHQVVRGWKIVTDASVRGGGEAVSPILYDDNGLMQLKIVLESLEDAGCTTNVHCGVHVHHDAGAMDLQSMKNLFKLYGKFENAIDGLLPRSRRGNNSHWCRSLKGGNLNSTQELFSAIDRSRSVDEIFRNVAGGNRYYKLNLAAYVRYGTVEFRQHSGSLDFEKLEAWVLLTNSLINRAKAAKGITQGATDELKTLMRVAAKNGAKKVTRFLRKRHAHFASQG